MSDLKNSLERLETMCLYFCSLVAFMYNKNIYRLTIINHIIKTHFKKVKRIIVSGKINCLLIIQ